MCVLSMTGNYCHCRSTVQLAGRIPAIMAAVAVTIAVAVAVAVVVVLAVV